MNSIMKNHYPYLYSKNSSLMKNIKLVSAVFLLMASFAFNNTYATARTWVGLGAGGGGASTDMNLSTNWSPAGSPTSADDLTVTFTTATAGATIGFTATTTINSLTVNCTI